MEDKDLQKLSQENIEVNLKHDDIDNRHEGGNNFNNLFKLKGNYFLYVRLAFVFTILFSLAVFYVVNASILPLFDIVEAIYASVAWQMRDTGDFFMLYFNNQNFSHQPPLSFWLKAISSKYLFDINLGLSFRLPSIIATILWLFSLYGFIKKHIDFETALITLFIAVSSIGSLLVMRSALPDSLLVLFVSLTMFNFYNFLNSQQEAQSSIIKAYIYFALSVLSYGIFVLHIVVLTIVFYILLNRGKFILQLFRLLAQPIALVAFLIVVIPWYAWQYYLYGFEFFEKLWTNSSQLRDLLSYDYFTQNADGNLIYYYLVVILLSCLPFSVYLLHAIKRLAIRVNNKTLLFKKLDLFLFLWIWSMVVLILFGLQDSFQPRYMAFGMTPIFIILARCISKDVKYHYIAFGCFLLLLMFGFAPFLLEEISHNVHDQDFLAIYQNASAIIDTKKLIIFFGAVIIIFGLFFLKINNIIKMIFSVLITHSVINFAVLPDLVGLSQKNVIDIGRFVQQNGIKIKGYKIKGIPSINVYTQQRVENMDIMLNTPFITYNYIYRDLPKTLDNIGFLNLIYSNSRFTIAIYKAKALVEDIVIIEDKKDN